MTWLSIVGLTFAATCASKPAPPPPGPPRPALEIACHHDDDCKAFDTTPVGKYGCCPGCTWNVANVSSFQRLVQSCKANSPNECPPLGCAMPSVQAKCAAAGCVLAPAPP